MKTGIELIAIERKEQIEKHGRAVEKDVFQNNDRELSIAASELLHTAPYVEDFPPGWDKSIVIKMARKSYKERLIIAGALIAAEIDRLQNSQED